jgi:hypothetical protein
METNPEPQLVTMRCPCDDPNPCCSETITSPSGLITVIVWECKAFTDEDLDADLMELYGLLKATFEDEGDETT